jgi:hypothetical protein
MRYMLQVYFNGAQDRLKELPEAERQAVVAEYEAFFASPEVVDGNQLQPPATATTVYVDEGRIVRGGGPFAAEPLGGYYLVEAADLDAAAALAARVPAARMGGVVEVRPTVAQPAP